MLLDEVLDEIPIEYRDRFEALHARADARPHDFSAELRAYIATVHQVAAVAQAIDLRLADRLASSLLRLVEAVAADDDERRRLVTAAVTYFVQEEDDDEITGVLGFDDDVQVVNAVARVLGRPDLVVPLAR